jgi:SNF2 family DNA or RNA helicase
VTGTPVENHLGDLWSLMAFAQPGLLGSFAGFRRRYLSAEGRADVRRVERLRTVVSPFLLRRSKRDRTVVPDLPDKIEVRRDCALSREQVGVYEAVVRRLEEEAKAADGTKRRGVILAGLTRLKQACVHPQLALGTHQDGLDQSSGKVEELLAIIIVHNLVCPGTVEERIARVLDTKRATAGQIVGDEVSPAVTEMSDADLHDLITLVRDEQILLRKV